MNRKKKILIVDDIAENRKILATILSKEDDYEISLASDGKSVINNIEKEVPDIILLDIMMPSMDGFEVIKALKSIEGVKDIPIIFITAITDVDSKILAFKEGGVDYITKPFNKQELLARVNTHLTIKVLQDDLKEKNHLLQDREAHLEKLVSEKTIKLENMTISIVNALENANFYNDNDTGNHIRRVSEYSALIAEEYGCDVNFIKKIKLYASLHDVGKVGISDSLLKKPGKYTPEEFIEMQNHVKIGYQILNNSGIDEMARNITYYHHEKWDGSGYVQKLSGDSIPLEARIVALADVYDALVSKRVYKEAFSDDKAFEIITSSSGSHFDPKIVEIYVKLRKKFLEISTVLE